MYKVINAFILKRTGERVEPGDDFDPESEQQAERLIAAGCIEVVKKTARAPAPPPPPPPAPPEGEAGGDGGSKDDAPAGQPAGEAPPPGSPETKTEDKPAKPRGGGRRKANGG